MGYEPTTILHLIDEGLNRNETDVLISTKRQGEWINTSPGKFREKVRHLAYGLYELGIRRGDRVSIHSENSAEWLICDQAILSLGAVNVPIYTTQAGEQIKYILENSDTKAHIVSNDELFAETKPMIKSIGNVDAIISILGSKHQKLKSFDAVLELGKKRAEKDPDLLEKLRSEIKPGDLATLIYTSGTTGQPKGVMLSHDNIASNVLASVERIPFEKNPEIGQRMLSYLPLSHVFERLITYMYLYMGYPIHYIEDINEIRDDFEYVKPYFFATIPRLLEKIHTGIKVRGQEFSGLKKQIYYWAIKRAEKYDPEHPPRGINKMMHNLADKLVYSKIRELFGGRLLGVISGGAALSPNIFQFMNGIGIYCGQGYGLTESSPVISVTDPDHMRIGSSGRPLSNVEVKIADDGEVLAKGPNIMQGYFQNEEQTDETLTDDGWLKTGDIGKLEDGYLFITDRKKSVFKLSTGKYVAPQPIETGLINSGYIDQAVVLGYQHKFCSALIVPSFDNIEKRLKSRGVEIPDDLSEAPEVREIIQQEVDKVNRDFSEWERVKKFVLLKEPLTVDKGELTPTHKVKRSVVNERYADEINSMYRESETIEDS
ncbi:long-chain fatty acid--CoA ligase [Aliifodinibius sp. S!AR15-10]|uniref:AMP-dependent synthetase/ligase n=1 Tax=Aliifodinibius sp. S!AR15-10 TaxID=2950437 RepID=UPI00285BCB25|nr:long-chain fatty acid--CoA ligase [Aliifodinibius sp. S!AR15-10]MDR8392216.1 long-chain fatty acid--CoA ligase [Aliifodinibius sp. S!AR15-10]